MQTQTQTTNNNTAVIVWNAQTEEQVRSIVSKGGQLSKALYTAAPKGFVKGLRDSRKTTLKGNSTFILSQLTEKGYKVVAINEEPKMLKNGTEQICVKLEKAPAMTAEYIASQLNVSLEVAAAMLGAAAATK
jgi:hypothetical protein